jgi:hypothetical protein
MPQSDTTMVRCRVEIYETSAGETEIGSYFADNDIDFIMHFKRGPNSDAWHTCFSTVLSFEDQTYIKIKFPEVNIITD